MAGFQPNLLAFDGALRRRGRLAGRLAATVVNPAMYPTAPKARAFWFDGIANFGDALTPWLLRRAGIIPLLTTPGQADLAGVGSILELLPTEFEGTVWGTGSLRGESFTLPKARVSALRGHLTRELLDVREDIPLGDPGILVSRFMKRPRVRHRLGIVPHHMHEDDPLWAQARRSAGVKVIDVRRGPSAVLSDIGSCETVLSTSLHGLITADSFGIPARWLKRSPDLWGGDFKFLDYESVISPGETRLAEVETLKDLESASLNAKTSDAAVVQRVQVELLTALNSIALPRAAPPIVLARALRQASGLTRGTQ